MHPADAVSTQGAYLGCLSSMRFLGRLGRSALLLRLDDEQVLDVDALYWGPAARKGRQFGKADFLLAELQWGRNTQRSLTIKS